MGGRATRGQPEQLMTSTVPPEGDQTVNQPEAKRTRPARAKVVGAIYRRIVVEGSRFIGVALTDEAKAIGLAVALPQSVALARPAGGRLGHTRAPSCDRARDGGQCPRSTIPERPMRGLPRLSLCSMEQGSSDAVV